MNHRIGLGAVGCLAITLAASKTGFAQEQFWATDRAAPELAGSAWLNAPDGKPVTLASRRGKVTIVHFWTFG